MNAQLQEVKQNTDKEQPRRVLFVCTGNTCRSPMAAALLNDMGRGHEPCSAAPQPSPCRYVATSAGLYATEGDPITPAALNALQEAGVVPVPGEDYTAHRARRVTRELVDEADEIVGLTAGHAMELMLRFPEAATKIRTLPMDITDPYGGSAEVYRDCLAQLRYCLTLLYMAEGEV